MLFYFVCDCTRDLFRSMEEGFFFGCYRERLHLTEFLPFLFEMTLLVSSAFPFDWLGCRGPCVCIRRFEVDRPHCCCVLRAVGWDGFFLFEAPPWPLISSFVVVIVQMILVVCCIFVPTNGSFCLVYCIPF